MKRNKRNHPISMYVKSLLIMVVLAVAFTQLGMVYHEDMSYVTVSVHSGDTIWKIASIAADDGTDVREVVSEIINQNGLSHNSDIYPGQILKVPVEASRVDFVEQRLKAQ